MSRFEIVPRPGDLVQIADSADEFAHYFIDVHTVSNATGQPLVKSVLLTSHRARWMTLKLQDVRRVGAAPLQRPASHTDNPELEKQIREAANAEYRAEHLRRAALRKAAMHRVAKLNPTQQRLARALNAPMTDDPSAIA